MTVPAAETRASRAPFWRRFPPLTSALFLANAGFFVAMALSGAGSEDPAVLALFGAKVSGLVESGEWWRLLSCAFLHIGPLHFLLNGYALWLLGGFVERAYGARTMLLIYVAGAAVGSVFSTVMSRALSAGASGAVFGLLGVTLLFGLRNRHRLPPRARWMLTAWLLPFFLASLLFSWVFPMIDHWAHLGGLFGGVLAALPFGNPAIARGRRSRGWEATLTGLALATGAVVLVALGFAIRNAASESLWIDAPMRTVRDAAADVSLEVPEAWQALDRPDDRLETEIVYYDRLVSALVLQVRPYVSGAAAMKKVVDTELREIALQSPRGGLLRRPEAIALRGKPATRVVLEGAVDGISLQRYLYFIPGRGRGAILQFEVRPSSAPYYGAIFERIANSVELGDDSPLARGWEAIAQGRIRDAIRILEAVTSGPQQPPALRALSRAYRRAGDKERAVRAAEEARRLSPQDPRARIALIEALESAGRRADVDREIEETRRTFAKDGGALGALAELAVNLERPRAAVKIYGDLLALRRDYQTYNNLARLLATTEDRTVRDPKRALRLARSAVEGREWKDPTFIDTLAEAELAAGRPRDALLTAEKAAALSPKSRYLRKQVDKFREAAKAARPAPVPTPDGGVR